ncbi:hypothetical protein [Halomonas sp. LBP4]|uniref:hypothetical protein n=1 Tax=Halomonas sp. LBP4 TaxID=2044917 RepID=UPI0011B364E7|nr:hypothetical protein [Halomonas sp. LBP4]
MTIYGYPNVGRFGLGHSLLAWARCTVWCRENDATMLGPVWLRPRVGPYLRRERDKREYFRLFTNAPYPSMLKRAAVLATATKIKAEDVAPGSLPRNGQSKTVVVFQNSYANNFEKHFHEIIGHGAMLRDALHAMTREKYSPRGSFTEPFVAIHVRLGDFQSYNSKAVEDGRHNHRLPLNWYGEALCALRTALGTDVPAVVYSDGHDHELAPLLALPNVQRAADGVAITHMLEMTHAVALIAAGSGFSFWSAFLGEVPRVVFPGQDFGAAQVRLPTYVLGKERQPIPHDFCEAVKARLATKRYDT